MLCPELARLGVTLLDVVVFDEDLHWWSLHRGRARLVAMAGHCRACCAGTLIAAGKWADAEYELTAALDMLPDGFGSPHERVDGTFSVADQNTFYFEDGQLYRLSVAAVLPGDPVC